MNDRSFHYELLEFIFVLTTFTDSGIDESLLKDVLRIPSSNKPSQSTNPKLHWNSSLFCKVYSKMSTESVTEFLRALLEYQAAHPPSSPQASTTIATSSENLSQPYTFPPREIYFAFESVTLLPTTHRDLERLNISSISLPSYPNTDFYGVVTKITYVAFMHSLKQANPKRVLTRIETEACWMKLLTPLYQAWDPRTVTRQGAEAKVELWEFKYNLLRRACSQVSSLDFIA